MGLSLVATTAPAVDAQRQGQDIGQQIEREYGVVESDTREGQRLNAQLDDVVERTLRGVNATGDGGNFRLRSAKILGGRSAKNDQVVNAFALPDGRIYVTLGLLRAIQNSPRPDDELAFVVGHEITHVTERHSAGQQKKALPAGIAAILLGAVTRNRAVGTVANAGAAAYISKFSRRDEYASDRGGLLAMHRAGYNLDSAITMMNRLKSKGEGSNKLAGWFSSHPLTESRVARLREMIAELRGGGDLDREGSRDDRDDRNDRNDRRNFRRR
jgi:predicted Zn-dependent protease